MGILSSKPNNKYTKEDDDYYYEIFKKFFDEYIELQPLDHKGPPFVMSFNLLTAAFYSYVVNVAKLMKKPRGVDHALYYNICRYVVERNDGVVQLWGYYQGIGEDRRYDNTMVSGIRLAKLPLFNA
jgi:hypothetical protein